MSIRTGPARQAPRSIGFVWEEAVRLIEMQLRQAADLDSKASTLIGLTTAVLALVIAQERILHDVRGVLMLELLVVLAYLLLSFSLRRFGIAPALPSLVQWAESAQPDIQDAFMDSMVKSYRANQDALAAKALYLKWAVYAMIGFAFTAVVLFMLMRSD